MFRRSKTARKVLLFVTERRVGYVKSHVTTIKFPMYGSGRLKIYCN